MNTVYNPTASSRHPSSLFAPTPWGCYSGGRVGKSCCISVPPYQPTLIASSPCGIASPDIYWGRSPYPEGQVGISHSALVPPYQPTLITSSPCGTASPNIYWGRSPYPEGQVGISHSALVPPVPVSPILQLTSITPPPHGMPSSETYWGRSSLSPPDSQWGNSPWSLPQAHSIQNPLRNTIPHTPTDLFTTPVVATEPTPGEVDKWSSISNEPKLSDEAQAITSGAASISALPMSAAKALISSAMASIEVPAAESDTPPVEKFEATSEFQLFQGVGPRKIDVITYRGFEYRRDRGSQRYKFNQRWVCRHASKMECKGKFKLFVSDPASFPKDTSITLLCDHNHEPVQNSDLIATTPIDIPIPSVQPNDNPIESAGTSPDSTPLTTTKFWQLLGISQPDHDTYLAVIHVRRREGLGEREKPGSCLQT